MVDFHSETGIQTVTKT